MKFIENIPKKLLYLVLAFFVIHFVLQISFLFIGFSYGMEHFDNPDNLIAKEQGESYRKVYNILSFPLQYLVDRIPIAIFTGLGYSTFILNSAL